MSRFRSVAICASLGLMSAAGCASDRYSPLTAYNPVSCRSLELSYSNTSDALADLSPSPEPQRFPRWWTTDPLLGWQDELNRELAWCRSERDRLPKWRKDCLFVARHFAGWNALAEPSLRSLPADWTVYRATYDHSLGVKVVARAVATPRTKLLVAKVLARDVPIGWRTVRYLDEKEWSELVRVMHALADTPDWYLGPPILEAELSMWNRGCSWGHDGAWAYIERFEHGKLQVQRLRYGLKVDRTRPREPPSCSGDCCHPAANRAQYEASLVVDHMMSLIQCAE